jgi:hypothetical protein
MIEEHYEIESVRPAEPPPNMEGSNWHCYVIVQGSNTIRGYRQGSVGTVTNAVKEIVNQLNERRVGKRGRVHLVMPTSDKSGKK